MDNNADALAQSGEGRIDPTPQRIARMVLATALVLLGLWILHRYLAALAWAAVLAIALWPLFGAWLAHSGGTGSEFLRRSS